MGYVIPAVATAVGATVSSAVYMSMTATGEFSASLISRGIGLTGSLLGAGAGYFFGAGAAATVKSVGFVAEAATKPALDASSKTVALGTSLVAGAVAVAATTAVAEGGKFLYNAASGLAGKYLPAAPAPEEGKKLLEDTLSGVKDMIPSVYIQAPHGGKMKLGTAVGILKNELVQLGEVPEVIEDEAVMKLLEDTDKYEAEGMALDAVELPVTEATLAVAAAPVAAPSALPEKKHKQKHK